MRKKPRFLADEDIKIIFQNKQVSKSVNIISLDSTGITFPPSDEQVLAIGQREERLIVTKDSGSGFSRRIVLSPSYNKTGAIIITASPRECADVVLKISKTFDHDDLVHARTEANLVEARIFKSDKNIIIKFE